MLVMQDHLVSTFHSHSVIPYLGCITLKQCSLSYKYMLSSLSYDLSVTTIDNDFIFDIIAIKK